jgi:hypothetical protein
MNVQVVSMNINRFTMLSSVFCLSVCLLIFVPFPAQALGLSPPLIEVDSLLRGTTQTHSFGIYRAPSDIGDVYIKVIPDESTQDFFVLDETVIVMLDGQNQIDYEFGITPGNASNGLHELKLRFFKTPKPSTDQSGSAVSVVTGVTAQIFVTVGGEEHLEYALSSIFVDVTEEGLDVPVTYTVHNTGNVDWRPGKIIFAFFNVDSERVGEYTLEASDIEPVKAGQSNQSFKVRVPAQLAKGAYTVRATFFDGEEEVGAVESVQPFEVLPPGSLAQSGMLMGVSVNKETYTPGEKVKVSAVFKNDGEVEVTAVLVLELSRDGNIVDLLQGEEYEVPSGEEFVFSQLVDVFDEGAYEINAIVEYGKKQTQARQVMFEVREPVQESVVVGTTLSFFNSVLGVAMIGISLILIVILVLILKRRVARSKSNEFTSQPAESNKPIPAITPVDNSTLAGQGLLNDKSEVIQNDPLIKGQMDPKTSQENQAFIEKHDDVEGGTG